MYTCIFLAFTLFLTLHLEIITRCVFRYNQLPPQTAVVQMPRASLSETNYFKWTAYSPFSKSCSARVLVMPWISCIHTTDIVMVTLISPQHKHWPTGPAHFSHRRASTLYLSLALQDHRVKCRASRLKITVARSMTNFATFSCILFLKFRMYCLTSVDTFLRKLFLTTLSSLCMISHEYRRRSGENGGQSIFLGASNFSNLLAPWASGSRSLMLRAALIICRRYKRYKILDLTSVYIQKH